MSSEDNVKWCHTQQGTFEYKTVNYGIGLKDKQSHQYNTANDYAAKTIRTVELIIYYDKLPAY